MQSQKSDTDKRAYICF